MTNFTASEQARVRLSRHTKNRIYTYIHLYTYEYVYISRRAHNANGKEEEDDDDVNGDGDEEEEAERVGPKGNRRRGREGHANGKLCRRKTNIESAAARAESIRRLVGTTRTTTLAIDV